MNNAHELMGGDRKMTRREKIGLILRIWVPGDTDLTAYIDEILSADDDPPDKFEPGELVYAWNEDKRPDFPVVTRYVSRSSKEGPAITKVSSCSGQLSWPYMHIERFVPPIRWEPIPDVNRIAIWKSGLIMDDGYDSNVGDKFGDDIIVAVLKRPRR